MFGGAMIRGMPGELSKRKADFFVDSVNGSDSADGKTDKDAFATLSKVQTEAGNFGDNVKIALKYGSEWFESIDLSSLSDATIEAYGDESNGLPILDGTASISGSWDTSTDRADANDNTYSQDLTTDASGRPLVLEDGVPLTWQPNVSTVDGNAGSFTISGGAGTLSAGTYTFYIHPNGSTNPNSDGKAYRYSTRTAPIFGNSVTVRNIRVKTHVTRNGVQFGTQSKAVGVLFEYTSPVHDAIMDSGEYSYCVGWHDFDDDRENSIGLEFFVTDGSGRDCRYSNCVYVGIDGSSQTIDGFGGHVDTNLYSSITAVNCSAQHARMEFAGIADNVSTTRLHIIGGSGTSALRGDATNSITHTDTWIEGIAINGIDCRDSTARPVIDGLRMYGDQQTAGVANFSNGVTVTRSVFVRDGNEFRARGPHDAAGDLDMTGCLFGGINGSFAPLVNAANCDDCDNNGFGGSFSYTVNTTNYTSLSTMQSSESIEQNSVDTDPSFNDPANGDFTPGASGLPANSGLERDVTCQNYTDIPADLSAAEQWILDNAR